MFLINGSIKCSDINYGTNSFYVYHNFGFVKSSTKSFSFELGNDIEQFRPAYVTFGENFIKISLGTYRFNPNGIIHYSFVALSVDKLKTLATSQELFARLKIIEESILYAKMKVKQIVPGDVLIRSNIEFNKIQENSNPNFYWETPVRNSEASNSSSANDTEIKIVGYYYAFNNIENYFITKLDSYISESSNSDSTNVSVTFPSSGTYYFHIRAVNSIGEVSRNTSHATVIYNNPPTIPLDLKNNGHGYYCGSANINIFSWIPSTNSDGDSINYELLIYKNDKLFYNNYIEALRCEEKQLFAKLEVEESSNSFSDSSNSVSISIEDTSDSIRLEDAMSKRRYANRLYYIFDRDMSRNDNGSHYYRLRAYDWAEQSGWSETCYYDIVNSSIDINSKVWTGYNFEEDFGMVPMFGKMFIKGQLWFFGMVYIVPELVGKLTVSHLLNTQELYSALEIKYNHYDTLFCKMYIERNLPELFGGLNITVPYTSMMYSKLRLVSLHTSCFGFKFNFMNLRYRMLYGSMFIRANGNSTLRGMLNVEVEKINGKLNIFREFSQDNSYDSRKLICKMFVDNYPPYPKIYCTVGHDWQDEKLVTFSWTVNETGVKVIAFEYYLSTKSISDFSNVHFIRTASREKTINLYNYNMDSKYYFYIRSIGENGDYSGISVYEVRYNNVPTIPSYPMYVNDKECIENVPIVSGSEYNSFRWPKSEHLDMDIVNYQLQISNKSDFSNIIIDKNGIKDISESNFVEVKIKYNYSNNNPVYYWRVRAYDRHQYTEYGYVGRFKCSTKPGIPTNLSVSNKD